MNLLTADNLTKTYADRTILKDVSFSIGEGEKIGVIGVNGTGKSTLLKLIAGQEPASGGTLIKAKNLRIEYLPQQPEFPVGATVLQAVLHGQSPVMQLIRDYEAAASSLAEAPDDTDLQNRLIRLSGRMDEADAWNLDSEAKSVLTRLGITDFRQVVDSLSGGQRKRVALASALVNPADLLILDEPTNHIDPTTVDWLEQYLSNYKGALLMVTHDRYFLERVTGVMLEIDQTRLFRYDANYEKWLELKAERVEREQSSELKRQNQLRRELAWIRQGAPARSTKQQARIDRFTALSERDGPAETQNVAMSSAATRLGRKTMVLESVGKSFEGKTLFRDFSYIVSRRERLGILGSNGCGKTTLLNLIAGLLPPDSGTREVGSTVRLGFFTQENEPMDPDLRVIDYIRQTAEIVQTEDGELTAAQMLETFLFPPTLQRTHVRLLSGGEKRRLFLLKILMGAPNVLLLDEPTNDLDIMTLSVLEEYLEGFPGAVVVVSHDRYFLDRVVERILAFEPDGLIHQYEGDFKAYRRQVGLAEQAAEAEAQARDRKTPAPAAAARSRASRTDPNAEPPVRKMKTGERIELGTIDARIAALEERIARLRAEVETASSDYIRLQELSTQLDALQAEHDEAMGRWVYLNELDEREAAQRK
jgi:ATP-binding cassette subfamily F protein uup